MPITKLVVPLEAHERAALAKLAEQERRDLRNQAAVIIQHELERQGLLPPTTPAPAGGDSTRPAPVADQEVRP